jgi:hypothetical protein
MIQKGEVKLQYVPTDEQVADVLISLVQERSLNTLEMGLAWSRRIFPHERE